ncbi:MAG: PEGA domain-containing protein [Myxococcota bacterium]|nr:PEGA domain-containing protein [Myxococcota bacterium]
MLALSLGLAGGVLQTVAGAAEAVTVAVLGVDAVDVPPEAALVLTDALRRQLGRMPGVRMIAGKHLVEVKLVFGCLDEQPACLAQVGRGLGAERIVYGSLRRPAAGGGYTVVLKQLHVPSARIEKFISNTVSTRLFQPGGAELEPLVTRWLDVLVRGLLQGGLRVRTEPPGAEVTLDGKPVGRTPLELREVATGTHTVTLALEGYEWVVRTLTVQGGLVHNLDVQLHRRAPPASLAAPLSAPTPPDRGRPLRIAAYSLLGLAAVLGGVAIYTWRTYVGHQDSARLALDVLQSRLAAPGEVNDFFSSSERLSSCQPPWELTVGAMGDLTTIMAYEAYLDHCRRGRHLAQATTALTATLGSVALMGVTSYILGRALAPRRLREGPDNPGRRAAGRYRPRVAEIVPMAGPQGGGVNLGFEF